MTVRMHDLPVNERPYEKLIHYGASSLTNEELIAILIKSGTNQYSAKELASIILMKLNNIGDLNNFNYANLVNIKGIGLKKSCVLLAAIELGKRINNYTPSIISKTFNSSRLVFEYYNPILRGKKQEYFYCVYLDNAKKIVFEKLLFIGTINYSVVHPREVFKEAYYYSASSIICVHNHPANNILPSKEDIELTNNLVKIGKLLGIKILDHIIIGTKNYYSFLENGDI